ncbi:GNAT family N-acetyltransferase [Arenibaculum pallidiluteum]|uniref:GNAT family N-acetyltransferase n=1 Tax=Arenibaculum pallidiluteum TaxID=2812559 RepID=UPI001A960A9E|nr:GNAT family N-acetyltransferase [Arenibaculum pallidiluteum]
MPPVLLQGRANGNAPMRPGDLRIEAIRTLDGLDAVRPAWEALWREVPGATPFQHPAWAIAWWRAFEHGELWTLAVRDDRGLAGILPLYREEDGRLLPLGVGITDWLDVLARPNLPLAPLVAALPALTGCGRIEFPALSEHAALAAMPQPPGLVEDGGEDGCCPTLSLPATARGEEPDLSAALPARQVRNLRHTRSRALRAGPLGFLAATPATAPALLEALFQLHARRWSLRGEPGVLSDPAVRAFHRDAVPALARAGLLRLYGVTVGDRLAAVHYGLHDRLRAYYYLGGFEPELSALGPGVLAVGHAVAQAIREGLGEFHFLRGREPYKYAWGARDRPSRVRRFRPVGEEPA